MLGSAPALIQSGAVQTGRGPCANKRVLCYVPASSSSHQSVKALPDHIKPPHGLCSNDSYSLVFRSQLSPALQTESMFFVTSSIRLRYQLLHLLSHIIEFDASGLLHSLPLLSRNSTNKSLPCTANCQRVVDMFCSRKLDNLWHQNAIFKCFNKELLCIWKCTAMVRGVNGLHMMHHTHDKILHRKVKNPKQQPHTQNH